MRERRARESDRAQRAKKRVSQDARGDRDAEAPAGLEDDVQVRQAHHRAEDHPGHDGADRQLPNAAPVDILHPFEVGIGSCLRRSSPAHVTLFTVEKGGFAMLLPRSEYTYSRAVPVRGHVEAKKDPMSMRSHCWAVFLGFVATHCGGIARTNGTDLCQSGERMECDCAGRTKGVRTCTAAGIGFGECICSGGGAMDAGSDIDNTGPPPSACSSKSTWTGGLRGSSEMTPGRPCIACHVTVPQSPQYTVAGTVYANVHDPDDCNGVDGLGIAAGLPRRPRPRAHTARSGQSRRQFRRHESDAGFVSREDHRLGQREPHAVARDERGLQRLSHAGGRRRGDRPGGQAFAVANARGAG